jgi:serine/threonine protein phosphatase 1
MNIIGDVQGEFDTVMALVKKMPDEEFLFLGDLVDRGPKSKELVEWVMKNADSTLGNHEHMMLDQIRGGNYYHQDYWWTKNGGLATLRSYVKPLPEEFFVPLDVWVRNACKAIPQEHVDWLSTRPLYYLQSQAGVPDLFVSHATRDANRLRTLNDCCDLGEGVNSVGKFDKAEYSLIWNRGAPRKIENQFQVFGHTSHKTVLFYSERYRNGSEEYDPEDEPFAVCVDTNRARKISGINWPTMKIYEQEYI